MLQALIAKALDEVDFCDVAPIILRIFPNAILEFNSKNTYFYAKLGKEVVGFAHVIEEEGRFILQGIGVLEGFREKGIGSRLADSAISFCEEKGATSISLKVEMANPAVLLYLKKGFFLKKIRDVYVLERRKNS